jgi:hypothetical protein
VEDPISELYSLYTVYKEGLEHEIGDRDMYDPSHILPDIRKLYTADYPNPVTVLAPFFSGIRKVRKLTIPGLNLTLLELPFENLTHLNVDLVIFRDDGSKVNDLVRLSSPLRQSYPNLAELTIRSDWEELDGITQCVPNLLRALHDPRIRLLRFLLATCPHWEDRVDLRYLLIGLESLADCLEWLRVDMTHPCCLDHSATNILNSMRAATTFRHFTRMKRLEILQTGLLHNRYEHPAGFDYVQVLPPFLEHLTVICPDERIMRWMKELLPRLSEFPYLRSVTLSCKWTSGKRAKWFVKNSSIINRLRSRIDVNICQTMDDAYVLPMLDHEDEEEEGEQTKFVIWDETMEEAMTWCGSLFEDS